MEEEWKTACELITQLMDRIESKKEVEVGGETWFGIIFTIETTN